MSKRKINILGLVIVSSLSIWGGYTAHYSYAQSPFSVFLDENIEALSTGPEPGGIQCASESAGEGFCYKMTDIEEVAVQWCVYDGNKNHSCWKN